MRTTSRGWLLRVGVKRKSSFKEIKNRKRQKVYFKIEPTEKQGDVVETWAETKWYSVANQILFYGTVAH